MHSLALCGPPMAGLAVKECSSSRVPGLAGVTLRTAQQCCSRPRGSLLVAAHQRSQPEPQALTARTVDGPFLEPFVRSFILGVGAGALLEAGHIAMQVLTGSFPGVAEFSPILVADHVTAFAAWLALYAVEAAAVMQVLKRFNFDHVAAASELRRLSTLPQKMAPNLRMALFKRLFAARTKVTATSAAQAALPSLEAVRSMPGGDVATAPPQPVSKPTHAAGRNAIVPAPKILRRPPTGPPGQGPDPEDSEASRTAKRQKELRDRTGYLKNMWYAAALSQNVGSKPVKVQLCGKEMVLFRGEDGTVHCIDNACPHRGAPLSEGWVTQAAEHKGEWPKRQLSEAFPVTEKGGFIWLFFGSKNLPADERPPIPYIPELDHPRWKPVYQEMEFDCNHFGVFENAIDMAHIHYLHGDSFGNQEKPDICDMQGSTDAYGVTVKFRIHNKPVNAFWALFQVPYVDVTAHAFLPSTSVVSFTLANGLSFITFVNTVPISATKSINRFALVRNLNIPGLESLFNAKAWDGMAARAMLKILSEDKDMVERLKYDQLPAEYSVRADLPQVLFRKLRQQYVDLGYGVPHEQELPPFAITQQVSSCSGSSSSSSGVGST